MQRIIQSLFLIMSVFFMEVTNVTCEGDKLEIAKDIKAFNSMASYHGYAKCPYPEQIHPCVCVDNNGITKVTCEGDKLVIAKSMKQFNKMASYFAEFKIKSPNFVDGVFLFTMKKLVLELPSVRRLYKDGFPFVEKSLKELSILSSNITSILYITPSIKNALVLFKLVVRNSPIEKIESNAFTDIIHIGKTLSRLDLCCNRIKHIGDNAFSSLKKLNVLNLHFNKIKDISVAAFPSSYMNPYLKTIDLRYNAFNTLNHLLVKKLNRGAQMWMEGNNIKTLSLELLRLAIQSSFKIDLNDNPIICDQNFKVISYVDFVERRHDLRGNCFAPKSLKGVKFSDLKPENFD